MTSLRELLRRRFGRGDDLAERAAFSYAVYWTKTAREWSPERRAEALKAVRAVCARPDFAPTTFERSYRLESIDESAHAGASLLALQRVLEALSNEAYGEPNDE
ncbi:MAG TPA: hypothetical protein VFI11_07245 [Anaerolineales bacterium]|nr:hypothetical protein [Anaerolineales bacterium]